MTDTHPNSSRGALGLVQLSSEIRDSAQLHPKSTAGAQVVEFGLIKQAPVLFGLEQMLGNILFAAFDNVFEFLQIVGPANAVEEFRPAKLDFVQCVFQVTGAQVQIVVSE